MHLYVNVISHLKYDKSPNHRSEIADGADISHIQETIISQAKRPIYR